MEIELKFQVPPDRRAGLRRDVATARVSTTRLQAVYADTPDRRLAAAGLALRLRKEGRAWVQTLKGRGDGLMQRVEHEVALPPQRGAPTLEPGRHAGTPAGDLLHAALADGGVLAPLYRTDIQRLHRRVRHAGAVVEIAYDVGHIFAGEHKLPVNEIEFELISGPSRALPELAARWVRRHGLWWDVRTKSERGFRLALGLHQVPAVKAATMVLPESSEPLAVWRAMLHNTLAQALPNVAELADELADDTGRAEHLHQLRVALRRLRTALVLFADWSRDAPAALALETRWSEAFASLGAARDADVLTGTLWPRLLAAGAPPWQQLAPAAHDDIGALVGDPAFSVLLLQTLLQATAGPADAGDTGDTGDTAGSGAPAAGPAAGAPSVRLPHAARKVLKRAWQRAQADARRFKAGPDELRHRARKRLKRLRYALEFVAPALARKPVRALQRALGDALDALGRFNDLQVAALHFRQQTTPEPAAWFAQGWLAAQHAPALADALRSLKRLEKAPRVWRRAR